MKKVVAILIALLLAAPTMAAVTVSCTQGTTPADCNEITVSYSVTGPNNVRAFALDISVSAGTIVSASDFSDDYDIYPGSIVIAGGSVSEYGSAICDGNDVGALGGLGTSGVTVEMGSLYDGEANEPAASGTLLKFIVSSDCDISLAENTARGGVVMEDPDEDPSLTLNGLTGVDIDSCGSTECYPSCLSDYSEWQSVGSPTQWCNPRQCHGDADAATEKVGKAKYWVGYNDLGVLVSGWLNTKVTGIDPSVDTWIAADFDHATEKVGKAKYRVGYNDLGVLVTNWLAILPAPSPDCLDCP